MIVIARKMAGVILLGTFVACSIGIATGAHAQYREKVGIEEAEPALAKIRARVEAKYASTGRLCGSSALTNDHPFSMLEPQYYAAESTKAQLEAEKKQNTGFHCLGIGPRDLGSGKDMFSYESDGTHFVARAFRAYLYDPEGALPRWEIVGEVVDGKLVVTPVHRIAPGGPTFVGHPSTALY